MLDSGGRTAGIVDHTRAVLERGPCLSANRFLPRAKERIAPLGNPPAAK